MVSGLKSAPSEIADDYNLRVHLDSSDPTAVIGEIRSLAGEVGVRDFGLLGRIHGDIVRLFRGDFPGYKASNAGYHDLEHTNAVTLAAMRVIHGLWSEGRSFTARAVSLGLIAALFHDTGLIQALGDNEGTGAKYTVGHEQRSIRLLEVYLSSQGVGAQDIEDCADMIRGTILSQDIRGITFRGEEEALLGRVVGTSDLLAQVADRKYLEKLPLLYFEFQEGGVPFFDSELHLLKTTGGFYENIFLKRLNHDFEGVYKALRVHFRVRRGLDRNIYMDSVEKNMAYLNSLHESCEGDYRRYLLGLRRGNIVKGLYGETPG